MIEVTPKPGKQPLLKLPQASPLSHREKIRTALMAGGAIYLTGWVASLSIDGGGETTAAELMTPNPLAAEFGTELDEAWSLMQKHRIKALPVIDRGRHVIGIVTQSDFFRHARAKQFNSLGGKLKELLKSSPTVTSQKPEVVGQIMTSPAVTAAATEHLPELARLLTERGIHQVPIVDARGKLAGRITQTDLIAALYRNMTGTPDKHKAQ